MVIFSFPPTSPCSRPNSHFIDGMVQAMVVAWIPLVVHAVTKVPSSRFLISSRVLERNILGGMTWRRGGCLLKSPLQGTTERKARHSSSMAEFPSDASSWHRGHSSDGGARTYFNLIHQDSAKLQKHDLHSLCMRCDAPVELLYLPELPSDLWELMGLMAVANP